MKKDGSIQAKKKDNGNYIVFMTNPDKVLFQDATEELATKALELNDRFK